MKITLKFNRNTHNIELPDDATVLQLKNEVFNLLNVPVESQKIIIRGGKPLTENDKKLSELNVKNGAKAVLIASNSELLAEPPKTNANTHPLASIFNTAHPPQPDKSIIELGPPPGALKNFQAEVSGMPGEPFIVRTSKGIAKLQFESDALFVQYSDSTEEEIDRIFSYDIQAYSLEQPEKNGYIHLCLLTTAGPKIFYFLPNQYKRTISNIIEKFKRS